LRRIVAIGIPELEEPAQAKAALAGLWKARQFHEGAALAAKAMALWPDKAEFRTERAKSLLAAGALMEAESAARDALLLRPEAEALWTILADSLSRRGRGQETFEALTEACGILPGSLALWGRLGRQALRIGKHQQAIRAFSAAAKLEPEKELWRLQLLSALWQARRIDQAYTTIMEALDRFPESASLHCQMARYFSNEQQHREAENAARRALEFNPQMMEAHGALFNALVAQEQFGEAFRGLQSACGQFPSDGSLWFLLARTATRQSRLDLAISAFENAVALPGAPAGAWEGFVNALVAEQRYGDAAEQAKKALLALPANHSMAVLMAETLLRNGEAIENVRTKMVEVLGAGGYSIVVSHPIMDALLKLERGDEALVLASTSDNEQASNSETRLRFAKALISMGASDKAEAELRCIAEEAPDWIPGLDALCEALRQQKKIKEALAVFRRIEDLNPDQSVLREIRYRMFGTAE
jgi:tetratricopeptide (TPR) repeat protein